jgi:NAD(P)-dependent dehydrogenase (short-subunit alcohol dehydrogenase family)
MEYISGLANLSNKTAVVVGGANGIGLEVSRCLASAGVRLYVGDWDRNSLSTIDSEMGVLPGQYLGSDFVDVRDPSSVESFFDEIEARRLQPDILVNLAGGTARTKFLEMTKDDWTETIQRNFLYVVQSTRRTLPMMIDRGGGGSIVNFTTMEAHRGAAFYTVYAAAKAAIENFSRAIAVEFGPHRIRSNTIAPDHTPSAGNDYATRSFIGEEGMAQRARYLKPMWEMRHPLGAEPQPIELAKAVLFLASDLSAFITGITLHVDGGTHAAMGFNNWPHGDGWSPNPGPNCLERLFDLGSDAPSVV